MSFFLQNTFRFNSYYLFVFMYFIDASKSIKTVPLAIIILLQDLLLESKKMLHRYLQKY